MAFVDRSWKDIEAQWGPDLAEPDLRLLLKLRHVFDDAWLEHQGELLQTKGHCHHLYRWLIVPWSGRPWRLLELAEATSAISARNAAGPMRDHLDRLLCRLASYSPGDYFGFFAYEFEALRIGKFLRRESSRFTVEALEAGNPARSLDVLLRIDGRPVYVEFKTLQGPQEEHEVMLSNEALLDAIHLRAHLSTGCEIRLVSIPDADEREEIVELLSRLKRSSSGPTEVEVAAGVVRYGFRSTGVAISFDTSREMACRRIDRVVMDVAKKAGEVSAPVVLMLKLYHFDQYGAQIGRLADLLSTDSCSRITALALFPSALIRSRDVFIAEHAFILNDRASLRSCLEPDQLMYVLGAAF